MDEQCPGFFALIPHISYFIGEIEIFKWSYFCMKSYLLSTSEKYTPDSKMYFTCWMTVGLHWDENNHNGHGKTHLNSQDRPRSSRTRRSSLARSSPLNSKISCVGTVLAWLEHLLIHNFTLYISCETTKFCQMPQTWQGKPALSPPPGISASGRRKEAGKSYVISNWYWLQKSCVNALNAIRIMPQFPETALVQLSRTFP